MNKSVLILTLFYQNYNYGGILQAYALYHKLEQMGFDCEELNYTQKLSGMWKRLLYRSFRLIEILKDPKYYREARKRGVQKKLLHEKYKTVFGKDILKDVFEYFMKTEFKSTKVYDTETIQKIDQHYDYYIVGGDQVWNPEWTDKNFFFPFIGKGTKIAYSCSGGKSNYTLYDIKKIKRYIQYIDVISVREKNFSDMLLKIGIENEVIADPVFLLEKEEWEEFARTEYELPQHYIFAYLLGEDEKRRKQIRIFAQRNQKKIVSIAHVFRRFNQYDEDFADVRIVDAGPREFIGLLERADFVVTDSFHGTAFSLLLEKQFINFGKNSDDDRRSLNVRLKNILEEYRLEERFVSLDSLAKLDIAQLPVINYERYQNVTLKKRKKAESFLHKNMF